MQAFVTNSVVRPNAFQHVEGPPVPARMKGLAVGVEEVFMLSAQSGFHVAYEYELILEPCSQGM